MQALFIHRSVGHNLLVDGNVYELLKQQNPKVRLSDYDQNRDLLTDSKHEEKTCSFTFPGEDTKPASYAAIFNDDVDSRYKPIRDFCLQYDIVILKSCYPNNDIKNDKQLEALKAHYRSVTAFFNKRKNKKLVIVASPPLTPLMTNPNRAKRARRMASWLATADLGTNVTVFNFYDKLADPKRGWLKQNYRRLLPVDSHPNAVASKMIGPEFVRFLSSLV